MTPRSIPCLAVVLTALVVAHAAHAERGDRIDALLARMTLEEKIGQLRLVSVGDDQPVEWVMREARAGRIGGVFNTVTRPDIRRLQDEAVRSRLGIPLFFAYDVIHGHRTVFPIGLGLASTWDMDAIATSGRISALEATADGLDMTFSPVVDMTREPRWGRVSEGFGEDPFLIAKIARVLVRAYQGEDLASRSSMMAVFKHFALYGAVEGGRDYNDIDMSPRRMFQDYFRPYKAAVEAGARGAMISLSAVNGTPSTANRWLLNDLLRGRWGFRGLVMSDHGALDELVRHGVAHDTREAAKLAMHAGIDMDMNDDVYMKELPALVRDGEIGLREIDAACRRVLEAKLALGLLDDPYLRVGRAEDDPADTNDESRLHREEAREVARKSLVLLQNQGDVLPLDRGQRIAVVGPLAKSGLDVMGSWSAAGLGRQTVSIFDGLVEVAGDGARVTYARGANLIDDPDIVDYLNAYEPSVEIDPRHPARMLEEAVRVAKRADVVVAVLGESRGMAHESASRASLEIPASQRALLAALHATGKPVVLVVLNGRPLSLGWETEHADAILLAWFPGTEGGRAVADVLLGDHAPSGKLPMTFPRSVGQLPVYYGHSNTGRPMNRERPGWYTSRYFDEVNGPLFPFGYGLGYTGFALSPIHLSGETLRKDEPLRVRVKVANVGDRKGATVVQLYLRDLVASVSRPLKELRRFARVELEPGESREVSFTLDERDLRFFVPGRGWVLEPGQHHVLVGLDSESLQMARFVHE